jgi:hypothetical protein
MSKYPTMVPKRSFEINHSRIILHATLSGYEIVAASLNKLCMKYIRNTSSLKRGKKISGLNFLFLHQIESAPSLYFEVPKHFNLGD